MDIRKIEAFSKVFEHKSFSKAGKALYLSQPTISAHVASLEQELGVVLFDRIGRSVVPTRAGEILYSHAQKIFEASDIALSEIRKFQNRITGKLDIGGSTIPANFVLPQYLAAFLKLYPEVLFDLHIGDSEEIITAVRENSLILGVVGTRKDAFDLEFDFMADDSLVLVMHSRIYEKFRHLSGDIFLKSVPWVLREEGSGTRVAMEKSLANIQLSIHELNIAITVRNSVAMARCVRAGMGAAITSSITVADGLNDNTLVSIDLPGMSMERSFYIVYNKRRSLFPAAVRLIDYFKSRSSDIEFGFSLPSM